jgi:hypothetical protein
LWVISLGGTLLCGIGAGVLVGDRRGLIRGLTLLQDQVAGLLAQDVEIASCIRGADNQRALALLEMRIDAGVLRLVAAHQNLGGISAQGTSSPGEALAMAKLYRTVIASKDGQVTQGLSGAEVPDRSSLVSPALAKLVRPSESSK